MIKLKKYTILLITIIISMSFLLACSSENDDRKDESDNLTVAVSIIPQETFVKEISGDLVDVVVTIPPGSSPTNYQPSPQELIQLSEAEIYFAIDVATEEVNILPKLEDLNEDIKLVDLADEVDSTYSARYFDDSEEEHDSDEEHDSEEDELEEHEHDHDHQGRDPHIWMSIKRVVVMVDEIEKELSMLTPSNEEIYIRNKEEYLESLEATNNYIQEALRPYKGRSVLIFHPSMGYYTDDYGLEMIAIENDGKQATAKGIESIVDFAKEEGISTIFYQEEFDSSQAEVIAKEIGGKAVSIAPLADNYIENIIEITDLIVESFN